MIEKIKGELEKLKEDGIKLSEILKDKEKVGEFPIRYQIWYTKALKVVEQVIPDRYDDFVLQYRNEKRKEIDWVTYVISDFCLGTSISRGGRELFNNVDATYYKLAIQIGIITSINGRLESIISNVKSLLEAEIFDNELDAAKNLLKKGYVRASGAICGVVLEKHFSEVMINHKLSIKKKNPTIDDYNELFKKESVYDIATWRQIQYLGDLRNLCDHDKKTEPTKDQIDELIKGTEKIIKTIF